MDIRRLHTQLKDGLIRLDQLNESKDFIKQLCKDGINKKLSESELEALIRVLLDYYTYSKDGAVLVTDSEYDRLMNVWVGMGHEPITTADLVAICDWGLVRHHNAAMVGSLRKIYNEYELEDYVANINGLNYEHYSLSGSSRNEIPPVIWVIAPKFDGISMYFEVKNHRIIFAATRGDGYRGQDLTTLVQHVSNRDELEQQRDGFYKCELVMSTDSYNEMCIELSADNKQYKNRRSAVSGIVNSPKNLHLAKYITAIILAGVPPQFNVVAYLPRDAMVVSESKWEKLKGYIDEMERKLRNSQKPYPFRTDGVVLYPAGVSNWYNNEDDIMKQAVAYKFNTAESLTQIEDVYVSIGRLGGATPVAKVRPVEVNETTVTDVSLSTFDKFEKMNLHYDEDVMIYSAGDVIPQLKLPEKRNIPSDSRRIKIDMQCPHCGSKLERILKEKKDIWGKEEGKLWRCPNPKCPRVLSGRLANFISKIGGEAIADKTIEQLYVEGRIHSIPDLLRLTKNDMVGIEGFGDLSIQLILDELDRLKTKETPASVFFGALGIPDIGAKTARMILERVSIEKLMKLKRLEIIDELIDISGIGTTTATKFADFFIENKEEIKELIGLMNIIPDVSQHALGNVVFTGFRDGEYEGLFRELNIDVSETVNRKTIAVVAADINSGSGKIKRAEKLGIPVYSRRELNELYLCLKNAKELWDPIKDDFMEVVENTLTL